MDKLDQTAAEKRVAAKLGFYNHLVVYLIVIGALAVINLMTSRQHLWFIWPLLGWGIAILFHLFGAFVFGEDSRLHDRMMRREMRQRP